MKNNPSRIVECCDAIKWLMSYQKSDHTSFVTSLPDISEFSNFSLKEWKDWFVKTAGLILSATSDDGVSVFYQSDIKYKGEWVDKAYLISKAAEERGHTLLWHKIVCRVAPGISTFGKPAYSHIVCFSKNIRLENVSKSTPDVIEKLGEKTWVRGIGLENCLMISKFIATETTSKKIIQPFCGEGSILAAANMYGLDSLGIERSSKRAEKARHLQITTDASWFFNEKYPAQT